MRRKQRWIPEKLIEMAEKIAEHIRKGQERGEFYQYPLGIRGSQLLIMALALGLREIAKEVGYSWDRKEEAEEKKKISDRDREFLEKLTGGFG